MLILPHQHKLGQTNQQQMVLVASLIHLEVETVKISRGVALNHSKEMSRI